MYVEKPKKALWVSLLLVTAVLTMAATLIALAVNQPHAFFASLPAFALGFTALAYVISAFYLMEYRINHDGLEIRFAWISFKVAKSDILSVSIQNTPWWMGVGIRLGIDRIAFTTRKGKVVDVQKSNGLFHHVWLTPNEPNDFVKLLKEK